MLQQFLYRICDNEAAGSSGSERIPTTGDVTHDVATRSVPTHPMRQVGQRPLRRRELCHAGPGEPGDQPFGPFAAAGRRPGGDQRLQRLEVEASIEIIAPTLEAVSIHGAAEVVIRDFRGKRFEFGVSGAGELEMDGEVDELEIGVSGAGEIDTRAMLRALLKTLMSCPSVPINVLV